MLFLIVFTCCIGFFSVQATGISCPAGWTEFDSYCYLANDKIMTWSQAQMFCTELGGYLAKITSARENDFVLAFARINAPSVKQVWIGLKWVSSANSFMWSDYSSPVYTNWAPHEPNGNAKEPCGFMWTKQTTNIPNQGSGFWNDLTCDIDQQLSCGCVCKRLP